MKSLKRVAVCCGSSVGTDEQFTTDAKKLGIDMAKRGIGVLITGHNVRDTLEITDRAIIINKGTIILQGPKEQILESELARQVYLGEDFSM